PTNSSQSELADYLITPYFYGWTAVVPPPSPSPAIFNFVSLFQSKILHSIRQHLRRDFFERIDRGLLNRNHTIVKSFSQRRHGREGAFADHSQSMRSLRTNIAIRVPQVIRQ